METTLVVDELDTGFVVETTLVVDELETDLVVVF